MTADILATWRIPIGQGVPRAAADGYVTDALEYGRWCGEFVVLDLTEYVGRRRTERTRARIPFDILYSVKDDRFVEFMLDPHMAGGVA